MFELICALVGFVVLSGFGIFAIAYIIAALILGFDIIHKAMKGE